MTRGAIHTLAVRPIGRPAGRPLYEFHILAPVRVRYGLNDPLFGFNGNVVLANFHAARLLAKQINDGRDVKAHPERAVRAGQLNAMGLIDEISHAVLRIYDEVIAPGSLARALGQLVETMGDQAVARTLQSFCVQFPPAEVYKGSMPVSSYLAGSTGGRQHTLVTLEETILLWLANINPAFSPFHELFDDRGMRADTAYEQVIESLYRIFADASPMGGEGKSILEFLREPMLASPHSLEGQLAFIRRNWGIHLRPDMLNRIAGAGDLIREETKPVFFGGTPETVVPEYHHGHDPERFTTDLDWMPNVVIVAKNTYVWLHQLSETYRRPISSLNQIPDEELDRLAAWGLTGLWLIGVWERSSASGEMKRMMGNPEAAPSAYSVYDYEIASALGGEEAFQDLRRRAWQRGIRLAGDMVPNHMGIYSKWVVERPDYFIQSPVSPFPNYRFTGHNFSPDGRVELRIEDGYWTRSDAAVVFQRVDTSNRSVTYIYHGNDGTGMAWNDTAQLNFLRQEVREAVINEIYRVAQKFPIIRFDAAMVLAKKHFQRLWFPEPGSGGDIPSRADHAMSMAEFNRQFPVEFWREVVDRINRDLPNTLLLAEAFWLLEGYFVRTLGMHRVYNSAFMHMMMKEENAKYRDLIAKTLAFNPEILKRYVNFMSNPDERTAVDQFGRGDKYFGVAMVMSTMPGLPMFAHGQIEGFVEKYGMEYQRSYHAEIPDQQLILRHERELVPVLKRRWLFSEAANFELLDFHGKGGGVNENVFVYTNRAGDERALMCYNNKYDRANGTTGRSVQKVSGSGELTSGKSVGEALGLSSAEDVIYLLREHRTGLEYLRSGAELTHRGLHLELQGFEYQLFLGFRAIHDPAGHWRSLAAHLQGRGVESAELAMREMTLAPLHRAMGALFEPAVIDEIGRFLSSGKLGAGEQRTILSGLERRLLNILSTVQSHEGFHGDVKGAADEFTRSLRAAREMLIADPIPRTNDINGERFVPFVFLGWRLAVETGRFLAKRDGDTDVWESYLLGAAFGRWGSGLLTDAGMKNDACALVRLLSKHLPVGLRAPVVNLVAHLLGDQEVRTYIQLHAYANMLYYKREQFEALIDWIGAGRMLTDPVTGASARRDVGRIKEIASTTGYVFQSLEAWLNRELEPE